MRNATAPDEHDDAAAADDTCPCNCSRSQPRGMEISELEFVQIIIVMVVMTVMVVVIICLLNHYRLSAWAFLTRQGAARRPDAGLQSVRVCVCVCVCNHRLLALSQDGCVWPTDSLVTQHGATEVMWGPRGFNPISRFQPTYPSPPRDIPLPPTICLSDGEELPPYKGPCTLQLRDPEQQLELSRASVRAPPNRTIFDSELTDVYVGGPRPPSSRSGKSAHPEGPPPAYSEVMAQPRPHSHSNKALRPAPPSTSPPDRPL